MLYQKRIVRCSARKMSREDARASLERSKKFASGTEVLDLKRRGDQWVATLLEPKKAEFPPKDDDEFSEDSPPSDSGSEDSEDSGSEDSSSDSDGPPSPEGGDEGKPKGEKAELAAVLDMLSQIADKLGIMPPDAGMGADDPMGGGPDGPPMPPGPPSGGGGPGDAREVMHKTKLGPGEVPPGGTPIGAPAFSSTRPDLSRLASFDAVDDTPGKSIKQAHEELTAMYGPHGFQVRQIKRVANGTRLAAKLSRR